LSWQAVDKVPAAPSPPAAAEDLGLTVWGGMAKPGEMLFGQIRPSAGGQPVGPVQQVLTLVGKDPAELARQAVGVANSQGLLATLSLREEGTQGVMELRLSVPVAQYGAVLKGLAALTSVENQRLENTGVAQGEFYVAALTDYGRYQSGRAKTEEAPERKAAQAPEAGGPTAEAEAREQRLRTAVGGAVASGVPARSLGLAERPTQVNLLIRVGQGPLSPQP